MSLRWIKGAPKETFVKIMFQLHTYKANEVDIGDCTEGTPGEKRIWWGSCNADAALVRRHIPLSTVLAAIESEDA